MYACVAAKAPAAYAHQAGGMDFLRRICAKGALRCVVGRTHRAFQEMHGSGCWLGPFEMQRHLFLRHGPRKTATQRKRPR